MLVSTAFPSSNKLLLLEGTTGTARGAASYTPTVSKGARSRDSEDAMVTMW